MTGVFLRASIIATTLAPLSRGGLLADLALFLGRLALDLGQMLFHVSLVLLMLSEGV